MKAVLLAGGKGTRLWPITQSINKHLLPIYDKPMIYYSLSTIMLAGVRDVMIVADKSSMTGYKSMLGDGSKWGMKIAYGIQENPIGIPNGLEVASDFIKNEKVMFVLGDNLLIGNFSGRYFQSFVENSGARIFTKSVSNPSEFGLVHYGESNSIEKLEEKPNDPKSNDAIVGIYFLDENAVNYVKELVPSKRGELEMVELLKMYKEANTLSSTRLPLGSVWLDTGTTEGLNNAADYVRIVQTQQSILIAAPEQISFQNNWINRSELNNLLQAMPDSHYKRSLSRSLSFLEES